MRHKARASIGDHGMSAPARCGRSAPPRARQAVRVPPSVAAGKDRHVALPPSTRSASGIGAHRGTLHRPRRLSDLDRGSVAIGGLVHRTRFHRRAAPTFLVSRAHPVIDPRMKAIADIALRVDGHVVGYLRPPALNEAIDLLFRSARRKPSTSPSRSSPHLPARKFACTRRCRRRTTESADVPYCHRAVI